MVQAGSGGGPLDRGHVDVRGEVLAADRRIRIVARDMPDVPKERAARPAPRIVELGRRVSVVDEQQLAALQAPRRGGDPSVEGEADLGLLALLERHALGGKAALEVRCGWRPLAALQGPRRGGDRAVEGEADLALLALRARHAPGGKAALEVRCGWRPLDVDERALSKADMDLAQPALADDDPVGRQRVEDLV